MGLTSLRTPRVSPWIDRAHPETRADPRFPFARDRDRILHSASFRQLQYKTQVYIVSDGDYYRTRITHSLEVSQLSRSLARSLHLDEDLAESIALAHDVGHTPFGHAGEQELEQLLQGAGGWNSNLHSLTVVDTLEFESPGYRGLNLTFATRQGIARHHTPFDQPDTDFDDDPQPTLEAQAVNVADLLAYVAHDTEDAVVGGLLRLEQLEEGGDPALCLWRESLRGAREEFRQAGLEVGAEAQRRLLQRARRHFINTAVREVCRASSEAIAASGATTHDAAVYQDQPLVRLPEERGNEFRLLAEYLLANVYRSPVVARQNHRERHVLRSVFEALIQQETLLPAHHRARLSGVTGAGGRLRVVAEFVASLSDHALQDLYAELFDPRERTMVRRM